MESPRPDEASEPRLPDRERQRQARRDVLEYLAQDAPPVTSEELEAGLRELSGESSCPQCRGRGAGAILLLSRPEEVRSVSIDQIYEAIRALPVEERLRLVERVVHDVRAGASRTPEHGPALLGLFADDPDLVDRICAEAYAERSARPWRSGE